MNELRLIKSDLINQLNHEKYFLENELNRQVRNNNIPYYDVLENLSEIIGKINVVNQKLKLINEYFVEVQQKDSPQKQD